jgi:hypothetical protein
MKYITLTVGKSQNPNTGEHWWKADATVSVGEDETAESVFYKVQSDIEKWLPNPFKTNTITPIEDKTDTVDKRIAVLIRDIENTDVLDEVNGLGVQVGLLGFAKMVSAHPDLQAAYDKRLKELTK